MSQIKPLDQINVRTQGKGLSREEQIEIKDSIRDYDVESYDIISFRGELFDYEAIFQNKDTTILHFKLKPAYRNPRIFEIITDAVRKVIDGRCYSIEADWFDEAKSLDVILLKFRNTLGGRERFFHQLGRKVKEILSMKI